MKRISALVSSGVLVGAGLTAVTFSGLVASPVASARTLAVPGSYSSIQAAVNAAHSGDTVLVNPGTYRGTVTINAKYVTIRANTADNSKTTIIGTNGRSAVEITNVPRRSNGQRATLIGLRLYGTHTLNGLGGGVSMKSHADALIYKCRIENNSTTYGGGVLIFDHSKPVVEFNLIQNNHATVGGGGIFSAASSSPQIYGNTITGNTVSGGKVSGGGPAGGGLYITGIGASSNDSRSYPNISRNSISNNSASFAGGGMILGTAANAVVSRNHIIGNRSSYGGGIHIEDHGATPTLSINVIEKNSAARNSAYSGSGSGGGVSIFGASRPALGHNSINYNSASYAGGGIVVAEGSNAPINGNRLYDNTVTQPALNGGGGGVFVAQASTRMTNNLLRRNSAGNGGGVAALGSGTFQFVNNVVIYNSAQRVENRAYAGGLYVGSKPANTVSVYNNIVAFNNAYQVTEASAVANYGNNMFVDGDLGMFFSYAAHTLHSSTQFNGNATVHYAQGNISTAPRFVNGIGGDVHLASGSAGVNQGRTTGAAGVDVDNRRRPVGPQVDMGIYER